MIKMLNCTIYMIQSSNSIPRYAQLLLRLKARHGPELDPFIGDLNWVPDDSLVDLYFRKIATELVTLGIQKRLEQLSQSVLNEGPSVEEEIRTFHLKAPERGRSIIQVGAPLDQMCCTDFLPSYLAVT
jgi:hypothetical protein